MDDLLRKGERLLIVILLVALGAYAWMYSMERKARERLEFAQEKLPENMLARYVLENRKLKIQVRDAEGKVRTEIRYIPAEGSVRTIIKRDPEADKRIASLEKSFSEATSPEAREKFRRQIEVEIQKKTVVEYVTRGWTSRFGYGLSISPGKNIEVPVGENDKLSLPLLPTLDWKFRYHDRWSALIQVNPSYGGLAITRHVDDFTPRWLHVENTEFGINGGPEWGGGWRAGLTTRTNF